MMHQQQDWPSSVGKTKQTNQNKQKHEERQLFCVFQSKSKTEGEIKLLYLRNMERNLIMERKESTKTYNGRRHFESSIQVTDNTLYSQPFIVINSI